MFLTVATVISLIMVIDFVVKNYLIENSFVKVKVIVTTIINHIMKLLKNNQQEDIIKVILNFKMAIEQTVIIKVVINLKENFIMVIKNKIKKPIIIIGIEVNFTHITTFEKEEIRKDLKISYYYYYLWLRAIINDFNS